MDESKITGKDHLERHKELHRCLDELVADFIGHTEAVPSKTTVLELMQWSNKQTQGEIEHGT